MLYLIFFLSIFFVSMLLLASGAFLLIKVKNKLPGILVVSGGFVLTLITLAIFLSQVVVQRA